MRKWFSSTLLILLFLSFLLCKDAVIEGAGKGLLMWYQLVLPSLLPFMILANIMIQTDTISLISRLTGPLMKRFPGVSGAGSFAVVTGFLCGYPMGAKISADLIQNGRISYTEGSYLLSFCNNTSPMFIIGVLFTRFIPDRHLHLPFFLILILSPLICGQLFRLYYVRKFKETFRFQPSSKKESPVKKASFAQTIDHALMNSFDGIVKVGLYMMIFSIFVCLLDLLIPGCGFWKIIVLSSLEITTGLSLLSELTIPITCRYILLMAATTFGGLCAVFQTASMIQESGLPLRPYIIEKLITALVTSLLTYLYLTS